MGKIRIQLPVGRRSIPLEEHKRSAILRILTDQKLTCMELSLKIGITYCQLRNPLVGAGNCSAQSYRKITKWLEKNQN